MQREATVGAAGNVPSPKPANRRRSRLLSLSGLMAMALYGLAVADANVSRASADSVIGDGPDDVITVRAFACSGAGGILYYVGDAESSPDACWEVELRRPVLQR